jgi:hypothetical protein
MSIDELRESAPRLSPRTGQVYLCLGGTIVKISVYARDILGFNAHKQGEASIFFLTGISILTLRINERDWQADTGAVAENKGQVNHRRSDSQEKWAHSRQEV